MSSPHPSLVDKARHRRRAYRASAWELPPLKVSPFRVPCSPFRLPMKLPTNITEIGVNFKRRADTGMDQDTLYCWGSENTRGQPWTPVDGRRADASSAT